MSLPRPVSVAFAAVVLAATAGPLHARQAAKAEATLYQRLGGYDVIAAVVDDFFTRFDADPQLAPFLGGINAPAGARIRQHFIDFLCAETGGPCLYNGRDMVSAHDGLAIGAAHFDAVIGHIRAALDAKRVAPPVRDEAIARLRAMKPQIVTS